MFDHWVGKIPWRSEMATLSSILAWGVPWREEPGEQQSVRSQRVNNHHQCYFRKDDWKVSA